MCGCMNVTDDINIKDLMEELGMPSYPANTTGDLLTDTVSTPSLELKPSQSTLAIIRQKNALSPKQVQWGIQPNWSKTLLINAKSETIHDKITFKQAFKQQRALIPCQGWYEWKSPLSSSHALKNPIKKDKYLIKHQSLSPMLMAAVYFPNENQFVTLTSQPNDYLASVHHRMPVIISKEQAQEWVLGDSQTAEGLFLSHQQAPYTANIILPEQPTPSLF
jgi:putative SOS response-associated peptidase YedK